MKRSEFLAAVFPVEMLEENETPLIAHPASFTDEDGIEHNYYKQQYWNIRARGIDTREEGWLYCVSTVERGDKPRRRAEDVRHAYVLPCDDIGTKANTPFVIPSYILETSPDNYQFGYLIDPFDVSPESGGFEYYDGVLLGLANAGYNDPGCRSATRVIKLPGSIHHSGFATQLIEWSPEKVWDLRDLVKLMGIEVVDVPCKTYRKNTAAGNTSLDGIMDATYQWLLANNMTYGKSSSGFVSIRCPWSEGHSDPSQFMAGYSPEGHGGEGRGFKCFHAHCAHRQTIDLIQWVFAQGGQGLPY